MTYTIQAAHPFVKQNLPFGINWLKISSLDIHHFHARSSDHRPTVKAQLVYTRDAILIHFDVQDRYVRCMATEAQQMVCLDSCVEAFLQPVAGKGYFNFEFNAIGTLLTYYIEDADTDDSGKFKKYTILPIDLLRQVDIRHNLSGPIATEITDPIHWNLTARIPLAIMERYVGPLSPAPGTRWRGNFFKCADQTSHPHWASWNPIGDVLKFHQPEKFGELLFQ